MIPCCCNSSIPGVCCADRTDWPDTMEIAFHPAGGGGGAVTLTRVTGAGFSCCGFSTICYYHAATDRWYRCESDKIVRFSESFGSVCVLDAGISLSVLSCNPFHALQTDPDGGTIEMTE